MGERSILVTGGAGFIGSHACKRLRGEGFLPMDIIAGDVSRRFA